MNQGSTRTRLTLTVISSLLLAVSPLAHAKKDFHNYNRPIIVDDKFVRLNGNVITGDFVGTLTQPAITVTAGSPVTILNSTVSGPAEMIFGNGVDLTVLNTTGTATNPNQIYVQKGFFVHVEGAVNLDVENCTVTGPTFGVYANGYTGNFSHSNTFRILNNVMNNIDGRPSDGNGGFITNGSYNAHAIQLNNVQGVPCIEIAWNQVINTPFQSQCNDIINMYESSGTSSSPILIHDNYLQGAYPADPGVDHYSGGGIITDGTPDDTAATATSFVSIYTNQVVSTANYGLAIAAGHDNNIYNNRVVSSGFISSGALISQSFSNGLNNFNNYKQPATTFFNNLISTNLVGLIAKATDGTNTPRRSDTFLPGQTTSGNNINWTPVDNQHPTMMDESNEFVLWQQKLSGNKITIGVHKI